MTLAQIEVVMFLLASTCYTIRMGFHTLDIPQLSRKVLISCSTICDEI